MDIRLFFEDDNDFAIYGFFMLLVYFEINLEERVGISFRKFSFHVFMKLWQQGGFRV